MNTFVITLVCALAVSVNAAELRSVVEAKAAPKPAPKGSMCWKSLENMHVWYSILGTAHVQMGYISAVDELNYPDIVPSGQPNVTPEMCYELCDKVGPSICGAAQFYACDKTDPTQNWCNLLTPSEFKKYSAKNPTGEKVVPSAESAALFVNAVGFYRAPCK